MLTSADVTEIWGKPCGCTAALLTRMMQPAEKALFAMIKDSPPNEMDVLWVDTMVLQNIKFPAEAELPDRIVEPVTETVTKPVDPVALVMYKKPALLFWKIRFCTFKVPLAIKMA
jgi:hypothetical protein